jgi:S1-C subfamily serine protease
VNAGNADAPQPGLLVTALAPDGPAARAGLLVGDIILSVAGRSAQDLHALHDALAGQAGQAVAVLLLRGGQRTELAVTVGEWPGRHRC